MSHSLPEPTLTSPSDMLDPALVAELYVQHADELRWFLRGVLRDADLANDVLQITFAKAIERGHTARRESLKGWLFRVAYHEAIAYRRREAVGNKVLQRVAWSRAEEGQSPDEHVVQWELVGQLREALDGLPGDQRRIVHMRIYDQKTFAVIAQELGIPLGTALSRMQAAMKKLRARFEDADGDDDATGDG